MTSQNTASDGLHGRQQREGGVTYSTAICIGTFLCLGSATTLKMQYLTTLMSLSDLNFEWVVAVAVAAATGGGGGDLFHN